MEPEALGWVGKIKQEHFRKSALVLQPPGMWGSFLSLRRETRGRGAPWGQHVGGACYEAHLANSTDASQTSCSGRHSRFSELDSTCHGTRVAGSGRETGDGGQVQAERTQRWLWVWGQRGCWSQVGPLTWPLRSLESLLNPPRVSFPHL